MNRPTSIMLALIVLGIQSFHCAAAEPEYEQALKSHVASVNDKVIAWRRDIHAHPELGNREHRTAALVAEHLRALGMEVKTKVAHTGVVGLLKGGQPGPVVALRADLDALPVTEKVDLPFASKVRSQYNGAEVGVMHACGHDVHTAILMGVAQVLSAMKDDLKGSVKFIFQPAEEGPPKGEKGGAKLMLEQGVLTKPEVDAIFGLHTFPAPPGVLGYRAGGIMAGADGMRIIVKGAQTHGAMPWAGVDPITVSSQIVMALQTITSRQLDVTSAPAIISIGSIHGGLRSNIIPDEVVMEGTIRVLDPSQHDDVLRRITQTAEHIAASAGATAEVEIVPYAPVTFNDPDLVAQMAPTLQRVAGDGALVVNPITPSEDFAWFQKQVPGLYFFLGINDEGVSTAEAAPNHSPYFYVNEETLALGVTALSALALDYLSQASAE